MSFKSNKSLVLCSVLSVALLSACGQQEQAQQQAMPVDIYTVQTKDMPVVSHLSGRANPTRKAEVRPQVSGILQKRLFEEGSIVEKGVQLYQIDPAVYEANVKSAQASLASAQASLRTNQLKAQRYKSLLDQKAVSKQDYDDAQANYLTSLANVKSAEAQLSSANINLAYTKVYAPISGTISRSTFTEGALVSAQQANALTTIQQLDPMYVDLGQTAEEYLALKKKLVDGKMLNNGKASVDIYLPDGSKYEEQGSVEFAEVTVDESTGMVNLRAIVPNPNHVILPGMYIRADINQGITPNAIVLQADGVLREAKGVTYSYIINDKGLVERAITKLGAQDGNFYIVNEGLKAGDKVITSNIQKLRPGMPVVALDPNAQSAQQPENK